jgi:hypothetical protein
MGISHTDVAVVAEPAAERSGRVVMVKMEFPVSTDGRAAANLT